MDAKWSTGNANGRRWAEAGLELQELDCGIAWVCGERDGWVSADGVGDLGADCLTAEQSGALYRAVSAIEPAKWGR